MIKRERPAPDSRITREVRKAERNAHEDLLKKLRRPIDTGTGFTVLKMQFFPRPLVSLAKAKKIGPIELQAADQFSLAVYSLQSGGRLSSWTMERVDRGGSGSSDWPAHVARAVDNFQTWQNYWSEEWKKTRNPMLGVIWDAVGAGAAVRSTLPRWSGRRHALMMPLFWIVHEIDGKRRIWIQEAGALITARLKASIAGFDEGEFIEAHMLDEKTAKKVPKTMIGRALSAREVSALLKRLS